MPTENETEISIHPESNSPDNETNNSLSPTTRSVDVLDSIEVAEITQVDGERGVAAALRYCKTRVLIPYLRLLSAVGLRPLVSNASGHWPVLSSIVCNAYLALVLSLLILGYILQFMACFRRDRGPSLKSQDPYPEISGAPVVVQCPSSLLFNFVIPSSLHLITYMYALQLFRLRDNEQLQNLMERVFVVSCTPGEGNSRPKRLAQSLWLVMSMAVAWLVVALLVTGLILAHNPPVFRWLEDSDTQVVIVLRALLVVGTLAQDIFQATLVSGYCLQAQLLTALASALRYRLLQHTLAPIDWMREMREFGGLLRHLNRDLAPAVCVLGLVSTSWALSGMAWLLGWTNNQDSLPMRGIGVLPVLLWSLLAIVPFVQAARLSSYCHHLRGVGHEVRVRPFVYQDTPTEELDSLLLFSSSLRLRAWLCGTPVSGRGLVVALVLLALAALTLGQLQKFPLPWSQN